MSNYKFTAELMAHSIAHTLDIRKAMEIIVKHKQKFLYGTAKEVGFQQPHCTDPSDQVWCYCVNLFDSKSQPELTPII